MNNIASNQLNKAERISTEYTIKTHKSYPLAPLVADIVNPNPIIYKVNKI